MNFCIKITSEVDSALLKTYILWVMSFKTSRYGSKTKTVFKRPCVAVRLIYIVLGRKIALQMDSPCLKTFMRWISIKKNFDYIKTLKISKICICMMKSLRLDLQVYKCTGHDSYTIGKLGSWTKRFTIIIIVEKFSDRVKISNLFKNGSQKFVTMWKMTIFLEVYKDSLYSLYMKIVARIASFPMVPKSRQMDIPITRYDKNKNRF